MPTQLRVRFKETGGRRLAGWAFSAAASATAFLVATGTGASQSAIPAWIPIYPGAKVVDIKSQPGVQSHTYGSLFRRAMPAAGCGVFTMRLKLAGFSVVTGPIGDDCPNTIRPHTARGERELNLSGGLRISYDSRGNPVNTEYGFEVVQRGNANARQEAGGGGIPAWVPAYPGSVPQGIFARREGRENFVSFRFTSRDDGRRILSWYQDRLRQMGFNVSVDVFGTNGALRSNTRDQSRAVKIGDQNVDSRRTVTRGGSAHRTGTPENPAFPSKFIARRRPAHK